MDKYYIHKDETPVWSRCERCGVLNVSVLEGGTNCENCKMPITSYMRELSEKEIVQHIVWI